MKSDFQKCSNRFQRYLIFSLHGLIIYPMHPRHYFIYCSLTILIFFISGDSVADICTIINEELLKVTEWIKSNRLLLYADTTNLMVFSPNIIKYDINYVNVFIDGVKVKEVAPTKCLGVIIDEHLSWRPHINHVTNKLNKTIAILCRARAKLYMNTLRTLYKSLVYPYLTYCLTIWGHT